MTDIFGEELKPWEESAKMGTFASAASGGCSEQKGVAAAPLASRREAGPGIALRTRKKSGPQRGRKQDIPRSKFDTLFKEKGLPAAALS